MKTAKNNTIAISFKVPVNLRNKLNDLAKARGDFSLRIMSTELLSSYFDVLQSLDNGDNIETLKIKHRHNLTAWRQIKEKYNDKI